MFNLEYKITEKISVIIDTDHMKRHQQKTSLKNYINTSTQRISYFTESVHFSTARWYTITTLTPNMEADE